MARRRKDERTGGGEADRGKAPGIGEVVYVDRPWPTPESRAATRRFIELCLEDARKDAGAAAAEVVEVRRNAGTLLPPPPGTCPECAVDHPHDHPHDRDSPCYGMAFHATHGRPPTWTDAMAHCPPAVRAAWRARLVTRHRELGLPGPEDLAGDAPGGTR